MDSCSHLHPIYVYYLIVHAVVSLKMRSFLALVLVCCRYQLKGHVIVITPWQHFHHFSSSTFTTELVQYRSGQSWVDFYSRNCHTLIHDIIMPNNKPQKTLAKRLRIRDKIKQPPKSAYVKHSSQSETNL
jgi:hypothetical protein